MGMKLLTFCCVRHGLRDWHRTPKPFFVNKEVNIVAALKGTFFVETARGRHQAPAASVVVVPSMLRHRFTADEGPIHMLLVSFCGLGRKWRSLVSPDRSVRVIGLNSRDVHVFETLHHHCFEERLRGSPASGGCLP